MVIFVFLNKMRYIFFLIMLTCSYISFAADKETVGHKYKDFELKVVYGQGNFGLSQRYKIFKTELDSIANVIMKHFGITISYPKGKDREAFDRFTPGSGEIEFISYARIKPGQYLVHAFIYSNDNSILTKVDNCVLHDRSAMSQRSYCSENSIFIKVDTITGKVDRIDKQGSGIGLIDGMYNNLYGCYETTSTHLADIDLDTFPELFVFWGEGVVDFGRTGESFYIDAKTYLSIFSAKRENSKLLTLELSNIISLASYQDGRYYSSSKLAGEYDVSLERRSRPDDMPPAKRSYSKVYFIDINQNDKLDVLLWRRHYESRLRTDPITGYRFMRDEFELYEEGDDGFKKQQITLDKGKDLLEKYKLNWRQGFPEKNLCLNSKSDDPLILHTEKIEERINDSILEQ